MKKLLTLATALMIGVVGFTQKLGHVDGQAILLALPERANVEAELQKMAKEFEDALTAMRTEYEAKVQEYQTNVNTWPEAIKQAKEQSIRSMENNMMTFQETANAELEKKQDELLRPMIDKVNAAIQDVGKENGYTYIFDSGVGVLLYMGGDDVSNLVKAKLGIPATAPATNGGN